tara:strand:+ start:1851 stop:2984 length:1134 start_codon:yes stop_codon:yes gene_type:complete
MTTDDIGGLIADSFGGEVVSTDTSQEPQMVDLSTPNVVDLTESNESETKQEVREEVSENEPQPMIDSSLNDEKIQEEPTQQSEAKQSGPADVSGFLNALNEQYGTEFKNIEDFEAAVQGTNKKVSEQVNPSYANEQIAKMDEFVRKTGRSMYDYIRTQSVDYSKVPDEVLMKESLRQNNPDLTPKELDLYFKSTYKLDSKKYKEDEVALGKIQLKKDASKARKEFVKMQEEFRMPNKQVQAQEDNSKLKEEWVEKMNTEVDDLESLTFEINENGETFDFALTDEHRDNLKKINTNLDNFFDRYIGEDGNWDYDRLNLDMFIRDNFDQIVRSVANQYRSKGTEQVIRDIKNPSFNKEPKPAGGKSKSLFDQLSDQLFG